MQYEENKSNALSVANKGRDPSLKLLNDGRKIPLKNWALMLCQEMQEICEVLDNGNVDKPYTMALRKQIEVIRYPELTSSARVLSVMRDQKLSITELVLQKSHEYTRHFQHAALDASIKREFDLQVKASLEEHERLNTTSEVSFDKYLSNYFSKDTAVNKVPSQDHSQNMLASMTEVAAR